MPSQIEELVKKIIKDAPKDAQAVELLKKKFFGARKKPSVKSAQIREYYEKMIQTGRIKRNKPLEKVLLTKRVRSLSGVAVVAVLTKSYPCPGKCVYCPTENKMPKSYLSNEPAVMRAILTKFHPYRQVQARLYSLQINGHPTDKIELIVMGGTFSCLSSFYQKWFVEECFRAANDFPKNFLTKKGNLEQEKKRNEKAENRIVGLTLETRPDLIDEKEIKKFRKLGATRVELGVQTIFDAVLKKNKRGHSVEATIEATKLLKDAGFKINYHLMPGLWGSSSKKDLEIFKTIYGSPDFQPDLVKIYPCVVTKNSKLYQLWKKGSYRPLTNAQTETLVEKIKKITPPYVRINRLIRDIPRESIVAGPNISNLRQILKSKGIKCVCIRCREVAGTYSSKDKIVLDRIDYPASGGQEVFLQLVSPDKSKLYALLRLRIPDKKESAGHFIKPLRNCALIREIHTFGKLARLKTTSKNSPQHLGLGRRLMREAEKIASGEYGFNGMAVIAGVGVRNYYRQLNYILEEEYMTKNMAKK